MNQNPMHNLGANDQHRAFRTAARLAGVKSLDQMQELMRDIGKTLANEMMRAEIPIPSKRFRPDVGHVQIDNCVMEEKVSRPQPVIRLQFEAEGDMGIDLKIKLVEFLQNPEAYTKDLFKQLGPMRRNIMRRRRDTRAADHAIYQALKGGNHA